MPVKEFNYRINNAQCRYKFSRHQKSVSICLFICQDVINLFAVPERTILLTHAAPDHSEIVSISSSEKTLSFRVSDRENAKGRRENRVLA